MIDAPRIISEVTEERPRGAATTVIGIAGAVAAGKSALATTLADVLRDQMRDDRHVEVVTTDDFLLPNDVLRADGLLMRKGFPESYDVPALRAFVDAVRGGDDAVTVPVYSHETYDIIAGASRAVDHADVVILEGVNVLSALDDRLDVGVYVHAEEEDLQHWYVTRFHELCAAADGASFYRQFAGMNSEEIDLLARQVWRDVNLPNLREHIEPSRSRAQCVVLKRHDHEVFAVDVRDDGSGFAEGS